MPNLETYDLPCQLDSLKDELERDSHDQTHEELAAGNLPPSRAGEGGQIPCHGGVEEGRQHHGEAGLDAGRNRRAGKKGRKHHQRAHPRAHQQDASDHRFQSPTHVSLLAPYPRQRWKSANNWTVKLINLRNIHGNRTKVVRATTAILGTVATVCS